ncbi:MAG: hypothetical protein ACSHYB_12965 [Roseibacillus sp.]
MVILSITPLKAAQLTLWLTFLVLFGRQIQTWQDDSALLEAGERFQSRLTKVAQTSLPTAALRPKPFLGTSVPPTPPRVAPTVHRTWPTQRQMALPLNLTIKKVAANEQKKNWTYRSEHFEFVSDAPLRDHVVREFTALFELTHLYCSRLPIGLHRLQNGNDRNLKVRLIEDYTHYLREGGAPGSGGIYLTDPDLILVPFEGLGLEKKRDSYALDLDRSNQTLMHEATHMMMRGPLLKDGWFVEGAAEYVATIPMKKNSLLLENHRESIRRYVTGYGYRNGGGHNLGKTIELTSLQKFMESDYRGFQNIPNGYPYSLLVFNYFAHSDGAGDGARLREYARALNAGANSSTARKKLLAGRDYRTLEKLLTNSYHKDGITLSFRN